MVERNKLEGRTQEWNVNKHEIQVSKASTCRVVTQSTITTTIHYWHKITWSLRAVIDRASMVHRSSSGRAV